MPSRAVDHRILCLALLALCGCQSPVGGALDESESNRILGVLAEAKIEASKEPDPAAEGKWQILVPDPDVPRALSIMRDEDMPRVAPSGVLDAVGKGSLVPSESAEHAQLVAGLAGDLEQSLEGLDGVLRARVHLNLPAPSPLHDQVPVHGGASVLIEHRGPTPPLSADAVQRFVAAGVGGMLPADVAVVMISRPIAPNPADTGRWTARRLVTTRILASLIALFVVTGLFLSVYLRWRSVNLERARRAALAGEK
jgi:type III secretion protein J